MDDGDDVILKKNHCYKYDDHCKYRYRYHYQVYVVDLCASLCRVAEQKCKSKGWNNVEVVEGDACTFQPTEGKVTLVTFSYSLSMIPPFIAAIDNGISMLEVMSIIQF